LLSVLATHLAKKITIGGMCKQAPVVHPWYSFHDGAGMFWLTSFASILFNNLAGSFALKPLSPSASKAADLDSWHALLLATYHVL
jgi:hypothetical protein